MTVVRTPRLIIPSDPHRSNLDYSMTELYYAAIFTLLLLIITYFLTKRFRKQPNVVLLTGLSDSGKTAIFSKIVFNKYKHSVTSLKENEVTLDEFNLKLIDLPGADRLRNRYWNQYKARARQVIFMLDSTTVESKIRDLGEYLYTLLSDGVFNKTGVKLTIACNKQDLEGAMKKEMVSVLLEKELNAIKETKSGQLKKTSDEEEEDLLARRFTGPISLDSLKVGLVEISVDRPEQIVRLIL